MTGVPAPDNTSCVDCDLPFNFTRLGVRVPMLIVSPWVAKGAVYSAAPAGVAPTPTSAFDLTSVLATVKEVLGTASFLTARDAWATPLQWAWSNMTAPRTDCPSTLPEPAMALAAGKPGLVGGAHRRLGGLARDYVLLAHALAGDVAHPDELGPLLAARGVETEAQGAVAARQAMQRVLSRAQLHARGA